MTQARAKSRRSGDSSSWPARWRPAASADRCAAPPRCAASRYPQHLTLGVGGRRQHRQRLRGVAGEDHRSNAPPGRQPQDNSRRWRSTCCTGALSRRSGDRRAGEQGADVFRNRRAPRTIADDREYPADRGFQRSANSGSGKRRISCSDDDQMAAPSAEIVAGEEGLKRWRVRKLSASRRIQRLGQRQFRRAVEADDLAQQSQKAGFSRCAAGRRARSGCGRCTRAAGRVVTEKLICVLPADPQLAEQAHKARIGAIVVDDKSGIDGPCPAAWRHPRWRWPPGVAPASNSVT